MLQNQKDIPVVMSPQDVLSKGKMEAAAKSGVIVAGDISLEGEEADPMNAFIVTSQPPLKWYQKIVPCCW